MHLFVDILSLKSHHSHIIHNDAVKTIMKLKDIAQIGAGHSFRGKIEEVAGSNVAVVQMKNVTERGDIDWSQCMHTIVSTKREPQWLKKNDILIAARGNHFYSVLIDESMPQELKVLASPHFYIIRIENQEILPKFLAWQLNQAPCQRYFEKNTEGSVTKSIRRSVLEDTSIAIPPLSKQYAILGLLETLKKEKQVIDQLRLRGEQINTLLANELSNQNQQTEHHNHKQLFHKDLSI